jgi:hypothetical protein
VGVAVRFRYLVSLAMLGSALFGCTSVHNKGDEGLLGLGSDNEAKKDVTVTFPAWVSEKAKRERLLIEAKIFAKTKCGERSFELVDLVSRPWEYARTSYIESNVDCLFGLTKEMINADRSKAKNGNEEIAKLRSELAEMKSKQKLVSKDQQKPSLFVTNSSISGARGVISGVATDNTGIAELRIDSEIVPFDESGKFSFSTFIPPGGKELEIIVYDLKGLSSTKILRIDREAVTQAPKLTFDNLDPTIRRVKPNSNAIALIVGVAVYSKTAPAEFADKDAQVFYDYANLKLGIPQDRIQTLVNEKADEVGLLTGVNKWLKRSVKQGESDVYIFFAGHGLASDDGDTAYLIPYDGAPDFLERTAISRDEVFREVSSVNPRSVTVFLDTCYSGDTRGESRLIAGRPFGIKLQEQSLPKGFTVLTAAGGDQIAKPLKEAQHGMFSYFLMKGMEGDADADGNNEITARELHSFVRENVVQQSGGSQVPELQGDGERVLVRFR